MGQGINELLENIKDNISSYNNNDYYSSLRNSMNGGTFEASIDEHFLSQDIDVGWIEMIEKTIIPIDNIIRSPRKFIQNEEEIVQIEFARGITTDSIKHLAQHTNLIASVEDDMVTPQKILNIRKEESYDTYENRFMKTLLSKVQYLLDKRMNIINDKANINNEYHLMYQGAFSHGGDNVEYQFSLNYITPNKTKREDIDSLIKADVSGLTNIQRIERLRKIFYDFQSSAFSKYVAGCSLIKPPLTITNLLAKNPDYKACVDLWMNLEKTSGAGLTLNVVTQTETPNLEYSNELVDLAALTYLSLKSHTSEISDVAMGKVNELVISEQIEKIIDSYEFNIDQIKRVFIDKIQSKEQHLKALERRMVDIIKEAIEDETVYKEERKAQAFKEALEKKKALAEAKKALAEAKKAQALQNAKDKEEAKALKEEEKKKKALEEASKKTKKEKSTSKKKTTSKKASTKSTKAKTPKVKSAKQLERERYEKERAKYWKMVKKYHLKPKKFVLDDKKD